MALRTPSISPRTNDAVISRSESDPIWIESEGQVANFSLYLGAAVLCVLVVPVLWAAVRFLATSFHTYQMTDQRLLETSGLLSRQTDQLELYRVKDLRVERPFVQRLFGRGRVVLTTSDRSTPIVTLNAISRPDEVAHLLRACVERCRSENGVREFDGSR